MRARGKFKALINKCDLAVDLSLTQARSQALSVLELNYSSSTEQNGKLGAAIGPAFLTDQTVKL